MGNESISLWRVS